MTITGTVGQDVKAGDTVTVTVNGKDYTTTVNADGKTWNVDVPGSELVQDSNVHAKVETEDAAGNPASAEADRGYGQTPICLKLRSRSTPLLVTT